MRKAPGIPGRKRNTQWADLPSTGGTKINSGRTKTQSIDRDDNEAGAAGRAGVRKLRKHYHDIRAFS